jgi:PKD repeat protein
MPVRADDHGSTVASATPLAGTSANGLTSFAAQGVIERSSDVDVFSFPAAPGSVSFTLSPAARSANLDALLELRDAAGNLLASANPVDALNATLSTTLASGGTYYLSVQGVGKGDPLLTGYSRYGSLGQYAVSGSVPTAAGVAPAAALSATPTRGPVPLVVSFDGSGSTDSDGSIVAHDWVFGDGGTAAGPKVSHTYGSAGSFTAQLRVTDNTGLTATRSVAITVDPTVTAVSMHVASIAMSLTTNRSNTRANAVVTLLDSDGRPVPGATVTGTWSGVVSGSASAISGSTGTASVASPQTKKSGTFVFTVTGVTLAGYTYQPTLNIESSDSITR